MKYLKTAILVLACGLVLSACNNASGENIELIAPEETSMLTENCKAYVDAMRAQEAELFPATDTTNAKYKLHDLKGEQGVSVESYLDKGTVDGKNATVSGKTPNRSDRSEGVNLKFNTNGKWEEGKYKVLVSQDQNFANAKELEVGEDFTANANNLLVNTQYYWKVVVGNASSSVGSFKTADYPRWISGRPMFNIRDNGGYMTVTGQRVKQGLVFRGGEITNKSWGEHAKTNSAASKAIFRDEMKIGVELDLRGASDIGDGYKACAFAENGDIEYAQHAIKSYEQTFTNTRSEVAPIFEILKNADQKHVYYHCYGGADRTGTIGFLLNGLLGVSYTDLVIDFELTSYSSINNEHIRNHKEGHQHQYDRWPALINQIKTDTTGGYAYDENALLKDNIANFLMKACNVPEATINQIRSIMLEPAK